MITEIGIIAGEIWHYLEGHKRVKVSQIFKDLKVDKDMVLMSLGWLAREGHVILKENKGSYTVRQK